MAGCFDWAQHDRDAEALAGVILAGAFASGENLWRRSVDLANGIVPAIRHPDAGAIEDNTRRPVSDRIDVLYCAATSRQSYHAIAGRAHPNMNPVERECKGATTHIMPA